MSKTIKPIVLIILDGWGERKEKEANAIKLAQPKTFQHLWKKYPHTTLVASGTRVGLPDKQMGNSEVGHLNLGAGRVVDQDICRISHAIEDGSFFKNEVFIQTIDRTIAKNKALHIFGLLSPGGIHSCEQHLYAIVKMAAMRGAKKVYFHAFLDGRDTPPKSAAQYIQACEQKFKEIGIGQIASLIGRFYAMDRDQRWNRIEKAYHLLVCGTATYHAQTALEGLNKAYAQGETDEFISPISIHDEDTTPTTIQEDDSVIFMNFRADRTREITRAFIDPQLQTFKRQKRVQLTAYVSLTQYDEQFNIPIAFPRQTLKNTLGEYLSQNHRTQLRIAETEKYAHVTFFFNGGVELQNKGEDRILIPSQQIETYDLQPEMSAPQVTQKLIDAIQSQKHDLIICNYANPDMTGHTGNLEATTHAIQHIDHALAQVISAIQSVGGEAIITGDHGNAELMFNPQTQQPHTAHTSNPVPFIYVGRPAVIIKNDAALCDIAPTLLTLMDLPQPNEMTGTSIIQFKKD